MSKRAVFVWLVGVALVCLACRSKPIPLSARAGSSFSLFLVGEQWAGEPGAPATRNNNVGFGGTIYWEGGLADVQRGEVEFYLWDGQDELPLETQLLTRVHPDPASDLSIESGMEVFPLGNLGIGQVMAIVYIPATTPEGSYQLRARKVLRDFQGQSPPALTIATLKYDEAFEVLEAGPFGPPDFEKTPPNAGWGNYSMDIPLNLQGLYPHPKLLLKLPDSPLPSAAHLVVTVPGNIAVRAVFEEQNPGRRSVVTWSVDAGELAIDFVNLESPPQVASLAIAYEPGPGYVRIDDTNPIGAHFAVDLGETQFWDADGNPIAGVPSLGPIR